MPKINTTTNQHAATTQSKKGIQTTDSPYLKRFDQYDYRLIAEIEKGKKIPKTDIWIPALVINDDELDPFYRPKLFDIPDWKPHYKVKDYSQATYIIFDIETTGLNPEIDEIKMIGFCNEKGRYVSLEAGFKDSWHGELTEKIILEKFLEVIRSKNPDFIATYNGTSFDLPFIKTRLDKYGIPHNIVLGKKKKTVNTFQINSRPIPFVPVYWEGISHIDIYQQVLALDFSQRSLNAYSLKNVPYDWGLKQKGTEDRVEIDGEILVQYRPEDMPTIRQYLIDDVLDTKLLADYLIPPIWYLQLFLDWNLQACATNGNGGKLNWMMLKEYGLDQLRGDARNNIVPIPLKKAYNGGYVWAKGGLYRRVHKLDVTSMYPNLMLQLQLFPESDPLCYALRILQYLLNERLRLKAIAKQEKKKKSSGLEYDHELMVSSDQAQASLKILINSFYGFMGNQYMNFADYKAACLVTAYGRATVKLIIREIENMGGEVIEVDTDGVIFSMPNAPENLEEIINEKMPEGINLEHEIVDMVAAFFPFKHPHKEGNYEGVMKSYMFFTKDKEGKIYPKVIKGNYTKRDKSVLYKTSHPDLLTLYLNSDKQSVKKHIQKVKTQLLTGKYPVENLVIKRKIKDNEKALVELGVGKPGEVVKYYMADNPEGKTKKDMYKPVKLGSGIPYSVTYYLTEYDSLVKEIWRCFVM